MAACVAGVVIGKLFVLISSAADQPASSEPAALPDESAALAALTCASASCHGSNVGDEWQTAYLTWASRDPHHQAHHVLQRAVSREIVRKLNHGRELQGREYSAYLQANCDVCHATERLASTGGHAPLAWGVTCGSCHGDPSGWLEMHLNQDRPGKSRARLASEGERNWQWSQVDYRLRDMSDEITRAYTCVSCHVGSAETASKPRQEVNHDLIAAGHPRLAFEYTSHLANLPRHWGDRAAVASDRSWLIGQLIAADAALDLLLDRAAGTTWPEFSEYNCASCHHSLAGGPDHPLHSPGQNRVYDWGTWYFAWTKSAELNSGTIAGELKALRQEMDKVDPDQAKVRQAASALRQSVRLVISRLENYSGDERGLLAIEERLESDKNTISWDEAAQLYLLMAYRRQAGQATAELQSLFDALEPAREVDSPLWIDSQYVQLRKQLNSAYREGQATE